MIPLKDADVRRSRPRSRVSPTTLSPRWSMPLPDPRSYDLLTVPRTTAFVAVSRTVAALLDEEAEHAARQALEAQRLL